MPLSTQLQQQLREWIDSVPEGTRFPSERQIADELGINRVTIQAAKQPFIDSGEILCLGNKGSFVHHPPGNGRSAVHPIQEHEYVPYRTRTVLKLMLYEDSDFQKAFWEKCAAGFHERYSGMFVDIVWVPQEYSSDTYGDYIDEQKPDIIQTFYSPARRNLLARLPKAFINQLKNDVFCTEHLLGHSESLFDSMIPVYFSPKWEYMNNELAAGYGLEHLIPKFREEGFMGILPEVMATAPELVGADTLWKYFLYAGNTPEENPEKAFEQIYALYDCAGKYLRGRDNISGGDKELFAFKSYLQMYLHREHVDTKWTAALPQLPPGVRVHSGTSCLGVVRESSKLPECMMFLDYMLSPEVQNRIPEQLHSYAFRRSSNVFYSEHGIIPAERLSDTVGAVVSYYHYPHAVLPACERIIRHYFDEFVSGQRTEEDALELSRMQYLALYKDVMAYHRVTNWTFFKSE